MSALPKDNQSTSVAFGDVVQQCKESVDRDKNPFKRYVEGGHMDSDSIHLRRWGEFGIDYVGPAFHRIFRKGQVLYGSRRTYLKKVAIAEFDGITANTTLVLETKNPKIFLQELLPFLMLTDAFTEHSIRESKGSTNPYINWPDIAKFRFVLPPMEKQEQILERLKAANDAAFFFENALTHFGAYMKVELERQLNSLEGKMAALPEVLSGSPESGCSAPPAATETGHWVLSLSALSSDGYCPGNLKPVIKTAKMANTVLTKGDLLISRSNTIDLVGFAGIFDEERDDVSFPDTMMRLRTNERVILPGYLELVLLSARGRRHMIKTASGTSSSMKKINRKTLGEFQFPLPNLAVQADLVTRFSSYRAQQQLLFRHIAKTRKVLSLLRNRELGTSNVQ